LAKLLIDSDLLVRARALKAVAELGRVNLLPAVLRAMGEQDNDCRFYAVWSAARLGQRTERIVQSLASFVERPGPRRQAALAMAVRILDPASAKAWLRRLWQMPQYLRFATIGIGVLGDPGLVGVLLELMQVDAVARVAGESFSMITGADLAFEDLDQDVPEGFVVGPTEDAADEDVAMDPDLDLPWPNHELVAAWWGKHCGPFQTGRRYLKAREIGVTSLRQTLVDGKQRQRSAAALELALLKPTEPIFEVRARGGWQQHWVDSWTS
jgi:uncharacterized protein (TIGR02270 family)